MGLSTVAEVSSFNVKSLSSGRTTESVFPKMQADGFIRLSSKSRSMLFVELASTYTMLYLPQHNMIFTTDSHFHSNHQFKISFLLMLLRIPISVPRWFTATVASILRKILIFSFCDRINDEMADSVSFNVSLHYFVTEEKQRRERMNHGHGQEMNRRGADNTQD